ncbi:hypothetical protein ACU4GD_09435 [Cupriavidus basilensis]
MVMNRTASLDHAAVSTGCTISASAASAATVITTIQGRARWCC